MLCSRFDHITDQEKWLVFWKRRYFKFDNFHGILAIGWTLCHHCTEHFHKMFIHWWYAGCSIEMNFCSFIDLWKGTWLMTQLPSNQHITYQLQYRKCGKAACSTCRDGQGHGPYWYAYWREGSRLRSGYIGKVPPGGEMTHAVIHSNIGATLTITPEEATPVMI